MRRKPTETKGKEQEAKISKRKAKGMKQKQSEAV